MTAETSLAILNRLRTAIPGSVLHVPLANVVHRQYKDAAQAILAAQRGHKP